MDYRKIVLVAVFFFRLHFSFAQDSVVSYDETVKWITTEFSNDITAVESVFGSPIPIADVKNFTFLIDNCHLIISGNVSYCPPGTAYAERYTFKLSIPVYDIDMDKSFLGFSTGRLDTKTASIKEEWGEMLYKNTDVNQYANLKEPHTVITDNVFLEIDWNKQANLKVQMRAAIKTLQTYCR
jgi:hypothetical protein